ncbi:hypothetical protein SPKIRA_12540 [Sphingomonas paucimobilis]|nr:hypothetical protein SPKIRA_12540 [Sphingomonas paucimobilis]
MRIGEGFAKGVDRAGADIAEHDPDRAQRKPGDAILVVMRLVLGRGRRDSGGSYAHRDAVEPMMGGPATGGNIGTIRGNPSIIAAP